MKGPTARKCAQRRVAHFSNRRGISPCPGHHWCTIFLWHVTSSINGPHNEGGRIGQKCVRKIRRVQKAKMYPTKNDSGEPEYRSRRLPHAKRSLYQWASPPTVWEKIVESTNICSLLPELRECCNNRCEAKRRFPKKEARGSTRVRTEDLSRVRRTD